MGLPNVAFTNPFIGKALGVHPNGDGTFTYQGNIIDQYQNVWDPGTGKWYNQNGQEWVGTKMGSGTGVFNDTPTVRGTNGKIYGGFDPSSTGGFDPSGFLGGGGSGSGGGSSGIDHFFDISPYQQGQLDIQNKQFGLDRDAFDWKKQFDTMSLNYNQLKADRDNALAIGDLELAKQKQASMDFWQQKANDLQASTSNARNATDIAQAQIQAGSSTQNTKINDDTNRAIAGLQGQISGYNAATTRGKDMGQLALDNNKFILDKSTSPRDLFGLYMMQRGITPDWGSLTNGGAPVIGDPLRVKDPFSFLDTTQRLPGSYTLGPGAAYNSSSSTFTPGQNGIMSIPQVTTTQGGPPQGYTDINPGGLIGGVPAAGLRPGMNLSTYGGKEPGYGSMFDTGTAYYDQGKTRPIGKTDLITPGSQVWVDYGGGNARSNPVLKQGGDGSLVGNQQNLTGGQWQGVQDQASALNAVLPQQRYAIGTDMSKSNNTWADFGMQPGYTTSPVLMTGDSAHPSDPWAGGAKPETIENPTQAPLRVKNTMQTAADYGAPQSFAPSMPLTAPSSFPVMGMPDKAPAPTAMPMMAPAPAPMAAPMMADYGYRMPLTQMQQPIQQMSSGMQAWTPPARYADGTDNSSIWDGYAAPDGTDASPGKMATGITNLMNSKLIAKLYEALQATNDMYRQPTMFDNIGPYARNDIQHAGDSVAAMGMEPDFGIYSPNWAKDELNNARPEVPFNYDGSPRGWDFPTRIPPTGQFGGFNPNAPLDTSQIVDRRALGTDISSNYQQNGMGDQYLQSSSNPGVNRSLLPRNMQTLYDYGIPLAPSLIAGTTGGSVGQANLASAFGQRGGGVLTSLQGMRNMSPGEQDLYSGYAQGVTGIPWADIADYLGKPTQDLGQAKRAGMAGF